MTWELMIDLGLRGAALILSWPVAFVVVAYWFRDDIKALVMRLRRAKMPGMEVEMEPREQSLDQIKKTFEQPIEDTTPTTSEVSKPLSAEDMKVLMDYFSKGFSRRSNPNEGTSKAAPSPEVVAKAMWTKIEALYFERIYRQLYGSQLEALMLANIDPVTKTGLKNLFHRAMLNWPSVHNTRPFEEWLAFITGSDLLGPDPAAPHMYRTTATGRALLRYLVDNNLTMQKTG